MRIAVFGAGYVGLVTGACFADLGHDVVVRDIVEDKIDALRRGEVPIHEDGLQELLRGEPRAGGLHHPRARGDDGAEVVYVAVGTPPTYSGDADLSAVWTVVDELPRVDRRIVVAMKSTVPVGTGKSVRHRLDERGLDERRLRLEPRVHGGGHRGPGLPAPGPDRDRVVPARGR